MSVLIRKLQEKLADDFTVTSLKIMIVLWAIFVSIVAIMIDNGWILAGILAYEVLP